MSLHCPTTSDADGQDAMLPPSYDEIYGDQKEDGQRREDNSFQTSSVTRTTTDQTAEVCRTSLPCVAQFGQYAEPGSRPQQGWFNNPTRISVKEHPEAPLIMVTDPGGSTVQIFTAKGECLSLLTVPHVNGGCIVGSRTSPLLLLAVRTSVFVYELDGRMVKEIPLSGRSQDAAVLTTVPYGERGFVAVRPRSLSICRGGISRPAVVHTLAGRYRVDRGTTPFVNVVDVAVEPRRRHLVVLDAAAPSVSNHRTAVYVMSEDGGVLSAIRPGRDPRCGPLLRPSGVAVDHGGRVMVSDGDRLVQFDGLYGATLIGDDHSSEQQPERHTSVELRGIAVANYAGPQTIAFTILTGEKFAQIRGFLLQS